MLQELLQKVGLSFDDLDTDGHAGEKDYLLGMLEMVTKSEVTVDSLREHVAINKINVENALVLEDEFEYFCLGLFKRINRKHLLLKARLKNYLALEAFLDTPEKAKKVLEAQIAALAAQKQVSK